jgi:hypothetical protein
MMNPRLSPTTMTALALAGIVMSTSLLAQTPAEATPAASPATSTSQRIGNPNCPEIVGKHMLLEKMTDAFGLTCKQEDIIEPLLHDEESVTKPLLAFQAFTPEERQAVMLKIKLAARMQIRPYLTPEQQVKSDAEAAATAAASAGGRKGGKAAPKQIEGFTAEETLSDAIAAYSAFTPDQKKELALQVKKAARRPEAPALTADQAAKIDADIKKLS